ncbi:MAG: methylenetetrahydrofolate reductase [Actinomycetota bacterium]
MPGLISDLLSAPSFEVIPMKNAREKASMLPPESTITVTASPLRGTEATLELATALHENGYRLVPHLAARMIPDRAALAAIIRRLAAAGIDRAFVIGGDAEEAGRYPDALSLLRELADVGHHLLEVGVAGYPEGHPFISADLLRQALIDKQRFATYIATQMCFDPAAIESWAKGMRADGVRLPVRIGIPGVSDPLKLLGIAGRIGVGTSVRYLAKNKSAVFRLLRPGAYTPDRLVKRLGGLDPRLGFEGLHVFTFNQIEPTVAWWQRARQRQG